MLQELSKLYFLFLGTAAYFLTCATLGAVPRLIGVGAADTACPALVCTLTDRANPNILIP